MPKLVLPQSRTRRRERRDDGIRAAVADDRGRAVVTVMDARENLFRDQLRTSSPLTAEEARVLDAINAGAHIGELPRHLNIIPAEVTRHLRAAVIKTGALAPSYAAELAAERGWLPEAGGVPS